MSKITVNSAIFNNLRNDENVELLGEACKDASPVERLYVALVILGVAATFDRQGQIIINTDMMIDDDGEVSLFSVDPDDAVDEPDPYEDEEEPFSDDYFDASIPPTVRVPPVFPEEFVM